MRRGAYYAIRSGRSGCTVTASSTGHASDRAEAVAARLSERFGAANVFTSASELAGYEVDGMRPTAIMRPTTAEEISGLLRFAVTQKLAVIPSGGRTKLGIGMPPAQYDVALDLSRMNRVLAYEPRDLTLGVEPGVQFSTLATTLASEKQFLPLNPPFSRHSTIGGILAADSASPLRHAYGGPRDFVLGLEFVTGDGAIAKSGGRVVKNVSGYDLHKLLIGSLGTLAIITRANFKTFPAPPAQAVFLIVFEALVSAMDFCRAFGRSPLGAMQLDVISPEAGKLLKAGGKSELPLRDEHWCVVISVAGNEKVVERHKREISTLAEQSRANDFVVLGGTMESLQIAAALLESVREVPSKVIAADANAVLIRIAALPTALEPVARRLASLAEESEITPAIVLRPHGLAYLALLPSSGPAVENRICDGRSEACAECLGRDAARF
jgi:glycolate oxidase FAD binding subunit